MADHLQLLPVSDLPASSGGTVLGRDSMHTTWTIQGGGNTRAIAEGDTIWVVDRLHPQAAADAETAPVWALVARIEVEKIRPAAYQSHIIRPGPGSCWFPPADLTHVVAQLLRERDDRDVPEPQPPGPTAARPRLSLPPPPPPAPPLSRDEAQNRLDALFGPRQSLAASEPNPQSSSPPVEPGTRIRPEVWDRATRRFGSLTRERSPAPWPLRAVAVGATRKAPPVGPPRAMTDTLRWERNDRYPWVSCLVDAEPLRQWAAPPRGRARRWRVAAALAAHGRASRRLQLHFISVVAAQRYHPSTRPRSFLMTLVSTLSSLSRSSSFSFPTQLDVNVHVRVRR